MAPGSFTVLHNGVVVQNHFELQGGTFWQEPPSYEYHEAKLPFHIQYHGDAVRFRNIWVREFGQRLGGRNTHTYRQPCPLPDTLAHAINR